MMHFAMLSREEQEQGIHRLANQGQSEITIATATGLSVKFVKRVLG
jgi:hypothetical protein